MQITLMARDIDNVFRVERLTASELTNLINKGATMTYSHVVLIVCALDIIYKTNNSIAETLLKLSGVDVERLLDGVGKVCEGLDMVTLLKCPTYSKAYLKIPEDMRVRIKDLNLDIYSCIYTA